MGRAKIGDMRLSRKDLRKLGLSPWEQAVYYVYTFCLNKHDEARKKGIMSMRLYAPTQMVKEILKTSDRVRQRVCEAVRTNTALPQKSKTRPRSPEYPISGEQLLCTRSYLRLLNKEGKKCTLDHLIGHLLDNNLAFTGSKSSFVDV